MNDHKLGMLQDIVGINKKKKHLIIGVFLYIL